jgi:hypothetical protein
MTDSAAKTVGELGSRELGKKKKKKKKKRSKTHTHTQDTWILGLAAM